MPRVGRGNECGPGVFVLHEARSWIGRSKNVTEEDQVDVREEGRK
jgi:hypothetical protein